MKIHNDYSKQMDAVVSRMDELENENAKLKRIQTMSQLNSNPLVPGMSALGTSEHGFIGSLMKRMTEPASEEKVNTTTTPDTILETSSLEEESVKASTEDEKIEYA